MTFLQLTPTAVDLPNGVTLNYVREGKGYPVIFIHGAMGDWRAWAAQWEAFTAEYDCISYSRRYSFPNPNTMPSPDHGALVEAGDLRLFMDALGIDRAILVGSSYGGFTALALAVDAPERVAAVIAVEPPMMRYAEMDEAGAAIAAEFRATTVLPSRAAFERGDDAEGTRILTEGIVARGGQRRTPPPEIMQGRMQNALAARMLALSSDEFPLLPPDRLAALPMPVLLMSGAETAPVHAAIFRNVARRMPGARSQIVEGSGHSVSRQQPERFNEIALGFLKGALAGPRGAHAAKDDCRV
jgi:pimeloyl-ACP methyl ester carboxylesterase